MSYTDHASRKRLQQAGETFQDRKSKDLQYQSQGQPVLRTTPGRPQTDQPRKWSSSLFSRQRTRSHRCWQSAIGKARELDWILHLSFLLWIVFFLTIQSPAQCLAHSYNPANTRRSKAAREAAHSLHTPQLHTPPAWGWSYGKAAHKYTALPQMPCRGPSPLARRWIQPTGQP